MADIWLATDPDHHTVAVRRLHSELRKDSKAKKRFVSGCEILGRLRPPVHRPYLGHGKVKGDLPRWRLRVSESEDSISRSDPVLEQYVGNILTDVAEALEHVHDKGFLHDFKPENIREPQRQRPPV